MKKCFCMLLACLLMLTAAALAECSLCGGDTVCDTCQGNGYVLMQAFGSDEQIKVVCTAGCADGRCPDCPALPEIKPYAFQDKNVEAAVRMALGKQDGDVVTLEEIQQITKLDMSGVSVRRLSDVCRMTALEELNLSGCGLENLPLMDGLTSLHTLDLSNNALTSVSSLKALKGLRRLDVSGNQVQDLSPLDALASLETLNVSGNPGAPAPEATLVPEVTPTPRPKVQGAFLNAAPKASSTPKPTSKPLPTPEPTAKPTAKPANGEKKITVEVFIGDDHRKYTVTTKENYLLDALLGCGLVEGEEVSWGFNVTIVDGVKANYNRRGEYWSILEYSGGKYVSMSDSIAYRRIEDGERYAFEMVR